MRAEAPLPRGEALAHKVHVFLQAAAVRGTVERLLKVHDVVHHVTLRESLLHVRFSSIRVATMTVCLAVEQEQRGCSVA